MNLKPEDKIEEIKRGIEERKGDPANKIKLVYKSTILKDGCTLRDYNIQKNETIMYFELEEYELYEGMQVLVTIPGLNKNTIHPLKVETSDTIFSVKV